MVKTRAKGETELMLRSTAKKAIKNCAHQVINKNREVFDALADL